MFTGKRKVFLKMLNYDPRVLESSDYVENTPLHWAVHHKDYVGNMNIINNIAIRAWSKISLKL